jgi:ATP-dependent Lon protease
MTAETPVAPQRPALPDVLPVLPLRGTVLFPTAVFPIAVGQQRSLRLIDDAMRSTRLLAVVAQRGDAEEPGPEQLYRVGTAATILQLMRAPDGTLRVAVQGIERLRLGDFTAREPYLLVRLDPLPERPSEGIEIDALRRAALDLLRRLVPLIPEFPAEVVGAAEELADPLQVAYLVASVSPFSVEVRQELLEIDPVDSKLRRLVDLLQHEVAVRELGREIATETSERLSKAQRDAILREQLRSIQQALGESGASPELSELRRRIEEAGLPEEAHKEVDRELGRLAAIPEASPEHGLTRTWLDWMASLPWNRLSGGEIDVQRARQVLDQDHYDLEKVKDRILEHLAVRKLRRERRARATEPGPAAARPEGPPEAGAPGDESAPPATESGAIADLGEAESPVPTTEADEAAREPILCFVGPPGVGKTSLGQSIARALGRRFVRMSLGGLHDEAEIRGHRRTYIGAMPGRIVQGIRRAETRDPVFMLDEIDKVGADWRGDPTSALLEVLDPAQNRAFVDTYLGVPFDLSQVLFIATANTLDTIPAPLRDRMEILQIAGYTEEEKLHIAEQYLVPNQRAAHGLTRDEIRFTQDALRYIVRRYTREAGVRELDRQIAAVCRKVARQVAESVGGASGGGALVAGTGPSGGAVESADANESAVRVEVTRERVEELLGRPRFFEDAAERTDRPGVATGLAWTPVGGEVLFVEAAAVPDGQLQPLILTGMLGDVMRESAMAALTYVRAEGQRFGVDPDVFRGRVVHVHVPAGAMPKDGPSAGVAITSAIASLALGRPVRGDVAMTGEITLRGKVLPIGGVKEKVLAAHRAGCKTVVLPLDNERDLAEVPEFVRKDLRFVLVDHIDEVLREALTKPLRRLAPAPLVSPQGTSELRERASARSRSTAAS